MLDLENQKMNNSNKIKTDNIRRVPSRLAIDIHSMPSTNEQSLKIWFILGGLALLLIAVIFLIFFL